MQFLKCIVHVAIKRLFFFSILTLNFYNTSVFSATTTLLPPADTTVGAATAITPAPTAATAAQGTTVKTGNNQETLQQIEMQVDQILSRLTPQQQTVLEKRLEQQQQTQKNPFLVTLFRPNYILPFYYTGSPYEAVYQGNTPDNQRVKQDELKAQLSFEIPVISSLFHQPGLSLDTAYTQVMYWQVYVKSQYFRETNYEPEVFVESLVHHNWLFRVGADHQSNGRGGDLERSWNRAFGETQIGGDNWLIGLKVWDLIFPKESSDIHNPDIAHFLGYENVLLAYDFYHFVFSLQVQNLESGLQRGNMLFTISYPTIKHISIYAQYFNGFGQSLIEYNHRTQSVGIGIAFNDWI